MMTTIMFIFLAGWVLGSFSIYSYIVLTARPEAAHEMDAEEDELPMAA
jgi:hypothetical protein